MAQPVTTIKELRIAVTVTLPSDLFAQAELTAQVQHVLKEFEQALGKVGAPFAIDKRVVSVSTRPRASAPKDTAPAGRAPWDVPKDD